MEVILSKCVKGGICRNLIIILNGIRFSEYYNKPLVILWPKQIRTMRNEKDFINIKNLLFNDIIKNIKIKNKLIVTTEKNFKKYKIIFSFTKFNIKLIPKELKLIPKKFSEINLFFCKDYQGISYENDRIPKKIKKNIKKEAAKIIFNSEISKNIDIYLKNLSDNGKIPLIGVSIRTWKEHKSRNQHYNINNYIKKINNIVKKYENYKIYICSDDNDAIETIKKKYPGKVYNFNKRKRGGTSNLNIYDIYDLLILCKCENVILNKLSNWNEFCFYFSNSNVETINEIFSEKFYEIIKNRKEYNFIPINN